MCVISYLSGCFASPGHDCVRRARRRGLWWETARASTLTWSVWRTPPKPCDPTTFSNTCACSSRATATSETKKGRARRRRRRRRWRRRRSRRGRRRRTDGIATRLPFHSPWCRLVALPPTHPFCSLLWIIHPVVLSSQDLSQNALQILATLLFLSVNLSAFTTASQILECFLWFFGLFDHVTLFVPSLATDRTLSFFHRLYALMRFLRLFSFDLLILWPKIAYSVLSADLTETTLVTFCRALFLLLAAVFWRTKQTKRRKKNSTVKNQKDGKRKGTGEQVEGVDWDAETHAQSFFCRRTFCSEEEPSQGDATETHCSASHTCCTHTHTRSKSLNGHKSVKPAQQVYNTLSCWLDWIISFTPTCYFHAGAPSSGQT